MKKLLLAMILLTVTLISSSATAGSVSLAWDTYPDLSWIDGYHLYRSTTPSVAVIPANLVANIPKANLTYTDSAVPPGKYYWVLTAYKSTLESGPSNEVTATIPIPAPRNLGTTAVTAKMKGKIKSVTLKPTGKKIVKLKLPSENPVGTLTVTGVF